MELGNLKLVIYREDDPEEKDKERIRIKLINELEMLEVEACLQINVTGPQSRRYHLIEATVIALRRAVSQAFRQELISDSLGAWVSRSPTKEPSPTPSEIDLELQ